MKLFTFGCSNTAPYHELTKGYRDYKEYRNGVFPPIWPELLSKELGCDLVNYGLPGTGNDSVFFEFCKHINEINKGDLVIIGWTFTTRYMWPDKKSKKWEHLTGEYNKNLDLTSSTHGEIIVNRMDKDVIQLLINQIYSWIDLINRISEEIGFTVKYWSCDGDLTYPTMDGFPCSGLTIKNTLVNHYIFDIVNMLGGERINEETNGVVDDSHWGETGHKKVCEIFYKHIKNNLNFIKIN